MKIIRLVGVGAVLAAGGLTFLRAQQPVDADADVQQKITALEKIIMQETPPAAPSAPAQPGGTNAAPVAPTAPGGEGIPITPAVRYFHVLRQNALRRDYPNAIAAANNIAGADSNDAVQKILADLIPELQKLKDTKDAAISSRTKDLLDRATNAVKSAKDPKELDEIIAELGQAVAASRSDFNNVESRTTYNQVNAAASFIKEWQSYLADSASGNTMNASNDLRGLANRSDTFSFMPIPRSELLDMSLKMSGQQPAIIDSKVEVHGFDDLATAISQLQSLQRSGGYYNQEAAEQLNALQNLRNSYLAYQDKNYTGALQSLQGYPFMTAGMVTNGVSGASSGATPSQNSLRKEILALKDQLLVDIAQGLLNLPDAPAPDKEEHATDYLLRIAGLRAKASDWTGLQQVLTVYGQFANSFYAQQSWLQEDLAGLHAYLVGEKLEAAGQTLDAIRSYRQSLATLGRFFPADPPSAKLKALAKQSPDLYQQALQQPISKTP